MTEHYSVLQTTPLRCHKPVIQQWALSSIYSTAPCPYRFQPTQRNRETRDQDVPRCQISTQLSDPRHWVVHVSLQTMARSDRCRFTSGSQQEAPRIHILLICKISEPGLFQVPLSNQWNLLQGVEALSVLGTLDQASTQFQSVSVSAKNLLVNDF